MKFLESDKNGNQLFTFEHSPTYQEVQHRFLKAVDSLNPEFIVVSEFAYSYSHISDIVHKSRILFIFMNYYYGHYSSRCFRLSLLNSSF